MTRNRLLALAAVTVALWPCASGRKNEGSGSGWESAYPLAVGDPAMVTQHRYTRIYARTPTMCTAFIVVQQSAAPPAIEMAPPPNPVPNTGQPQAMSAPPRC